MGCKAASGYALRSLAAHEQSDQQEADNLFATKPDSSIYRRHP
jgi:hypothetical protein